MPEILVTSTDVERSGAKNGRPWVLYNLHCTQPDGTPFADPIRSFEQFEVGLHAVELEPERRGDGFLARRPRSRKAQWTFPETANGGSGCASCAGLQIRLERLEKQMLAIINNSEIPLP